MGAHPDDRDSVTDMTLLMFTCKAGAAGVGDGSLAAKVNPKNPPKSSVLKAKFMISGYTKINRFGSQFENPLSMDKYDAPSLRGLL